jgi:hypothetical protein
MLRTLFLALVFLGTNAANAATTITFSESQSSGAGFNGQTNPYLHSSDGEYRLEFYWLQTGGHDHVSSGVENNHNNSSGSCATMQGVYIERVDGATFDLTQISLYGQATIGTISNSSSGTGSYTLYNNTSGSTSSPGVLTMSGYTGLSHVIIGDSGCAGGSGSHYLDDIVLEDLVDDDGDGYAVDVDCDDTDASTYPGATEYCDGHDDDCDGDIDEDDSADVLTWYADTDADGFGDAANTDIDCDQPSGYTDDSTDCDDTDGDTYPGAEEWCDGHDDDCDGTTDEDDAMDSIPWYVDADGDGEGDPTISQTSCYGASGYVDNSTDCDDSSAVLNTSDSDADGYTSCDSDCNDADATINVGVAEIWYDGVDQNCDTWSDYDQDGDGFDHLDYGGDDCDDEDDLVNIDATEVWYDGVDQDCDTLSDYDSDYDGQDSKTYGGEDCDDGDPNTYTGAPDTPYDGVVTDCLNADDYDADGDGSTSIDYEGDDCDDANSEIYPEAAEVWYDGVDQDCDGNDTDQDEDGFVLDEDCDDEDPTVYPENGNLDADCNLIQKGGCSTTGRSPNSVYCMFVFGILLFRRKKQQA